MEGEESSSAESGPAVSTRPKAVTFDEMKRVQDMATAMASLKGVLTPQTESSPPAIPRPPWDRWQWSYPPQPHFSGVPSSPPQQQTTAGLGEGFPQTVDAVLEFLDSIHLGRLKSKFAEEAVSGLKLQLMLGQFRNQFDTMGVTPLDVAVLENSMRSNGWLQQWKLS
jgi:hypothetical protein